MDPSDSPHPAKLVWLHRCVVVIGGVCATLGLLVLIGWHLHLPALIQLRPGMAPMQYNTALCFILAGIALCLRASTRAPVAVSALGAVVSLVAGLTLSEYLFRINLGIDLLLFRTYLLTQTSHLGRMSPVSALCFTLAGVALLLLGLRNRRWWQSLAVGSLASIIISISVVALLGYALGLPGTYGWGQLTRIAAHTAAGVGLLGVGIFILAWHLALRRDERTPRWLPVTMALGIFTATLVLYFALDRKQDEDITKTVRAGAESVKGQTILRVDGRMRALVRMARRWEFSGRPAQATWEADAINYVHDFPDLQAIQWIDGSRHIRWVAPLEGNEGKLDLDLIEEPHRRAAAEKAQEEHQPTITPAVPLFRGGLGFVIYVPLEPGGKFDGWIAITIKAQTLFERYFPPTVAPGEALRISQAGQVLWERATAAPPGHENWAVEDKVELAGTTWDIRVWPTPELAQRLDDPLPEIVFLSGTLAALILAVVCSLAQRSSRQAAEIMQVNASLQAALDEVKTLEGLLPICACCKRVRDDTGYWNQIESYVGRRTRVSFSHGYCPECAVKTFKEFGLDVPDHVMADLAAHRFE